MCVCVCVRTCVVCLVGTDVVWGFEAEVEAEGRTLSILTFCYFLSFFLRCPRRASARYRRASYAKTGRLGILGPHVQGVCVYVIVWVCVCVKVM